MTVSTSYSPIEVAWSTSSQAIPITWPFFASSDLIVTEIDSDDVETVKTITTHYTVTGGTDANGLPATGTVTMVGSATSGSTIKVERSTSKVQSRSFANGGAFPSKAVEASLDRSILIAQEVAYNSVSLPDASADQYIGWNAAGTALENKDGADFTLTIGTVTTGAAGTSATATITGTATDAVLNLTIPRGDTGSSGAGTGDVVGPGSATNNGVVGFDGTTGKLVKELTAGTHYVVPGGALGTPSSGILTNCTGLPQAGVTGLTTADSPLFTGVSIGNADTTLTRTGAGDIAVEGNQVYRAGGTDVALADGGTGASLADPNADRIMFWDDSGGAVTWLTVGTGLSITGTTLDATSGTAATQADQETATSTTAYVSPGRQQYHPSAAKAWVYFNSSGTVLASYNITSVTDNGTGDWTVNIATDMSSVNYCAVATAVGSDAAPSFAYAYTIAAGTFRVRAYDTAGVGLVDTSVMVAFYGDQ